MKECLKEAKMICFEVAIILGLLVSLVMIVIAIVNAVGGEGPCVHIDSITTEMMQSSDRPRCYGIFPTDNDDMNNTTFD